MASQPDFSQLDKIRSVEELANLQASTQREVESLSSEYEALAMPPAVQEAWDAAVALNGEIGRRIEQTNKRRAIVESMAGQENHVERIGDEAFTAPKPSAREVDIYDLSTIRTSVGSPEAATTEIRDRAFKAVELSRFGHLDDDRKDVQARVGGLLEEFDDDHGTIAQRVLMTGSPTYKRAFGKALLEKPLSYEEQRALSLTGASGGFAVPFDLDPTVIGTSNGSVNPLRQISRVIPITTDEWRGVSSGAVTTAYAAEATETTDNAPTLAQPTISTEKAQAFIPFSIEVGMDWSGLQSEMARLLSESKDDLEATKFFLGTGTNEPFGVIVGATNTITATTPQTMDAEDLYRLSGALPPRYQSRASIVANRAIWNLVRQFVLTGQSNPWKDLDEGTSNEGRVGTLLGYPAYEASAMDSSPATNNEIAILGDFSRFVIIDRVGLQVETIQHLVGTNHRPTGQRGLYAFWRNGSKVVDANAFRVLLGIA